MKKIILLALVALAACQSNPSEESAELAGLNTELIEMPLGDNVVYAVIVKDSSAVNEQKGYSVKFMLEDKVWYDTIYMELSANKAVQGEVIFSEAVVNDMGGASFEVNPFEI